jgi:tetratricopeptide (TPR) repeat protein
MIKHLLVALAMGAVVLSGPAGAQTGKPVKQKEAKIEKAEEAYQEMAEKRRATEATAEKLSLTKKFLDEFPETDRTASAVGAAFYYQGEDIGDMPGAVAYAEAIRAKVSDPKIAEAVDKEMVYIYGTSRMFPKMIEVADRLLASGSLDFSDHSTIIESATKAEDWGLALQYCEKAKALATPESYRKQYPDKEFKEEEIEKAVNNRAGMLLVMGGWARANQGDVEQALSDFAKADELVPRTFFDTGENDLNLYWGETLLMKGDHRAAADKLAMDALVMGNERALAGLKKAYAATHGGDAGFDAYAAELHGAIAKSVGDFELADYAGKRHRLSDLRKELTLLAFWFPT